MRWAVGLVALAIANGCAGDASEPAGSEESEAARAERKCREFIGRLCSQYVRCGVETASGEPITDAVCAAALPDAVADCVNGSSDEIAKTSDADFDACTVALRDEACDLVCNRVPEDPAECLALEGYEPQTLATTCAEN